MQIFDMDGTLIDSNGIWKDVDTAFLAKRGLPYTKEYYEGVAHTIFPLAARFTKEFCHLPESEEAIMAEWMDMAGDLYGTSVPVKPGVREYLEKLRSAGERMIVVTSAVPVHCRTALDHLGLTPYFERVIFAQELRREKKDPQLWRLSAEMMRVKPVLFIAGDKDPVGANGAGVRRTYQEFLRAGMQDCTLKLYPGLRHEILNEKGWQREIFRDIGLWLTAKL